MNLIKYFIFIIFISISLNANIKKDIHIGLSIKKSNSIAQSKIKSVINRFILEINKNLDGNIYFEIINDEKKLINKFKEFKNLNIIITYPDSYFRNKEVIQKNTSEVSLYSNKAEFIQYYLIANKKSKIKNINDIRNKRFEIYENDDKYNIWLDYLTRKEFNLSYKKLISGENFTNKENMLVLNTYFNKSDFTVVSKNTYEDMLILNPSLKYKLQVIKKSKPIYVDMLSFVHIDTPSKVAEKIKEIFFNKLFQKKFNYLFNVINNTSATKEITFEELKELEEFYYEYSKLKQ